MIERILIALFLILIVGAGFIIYCEPNFFVNEFKGKTQRYQLLATVAIGLIVVYIAVRNYSETRGTNLGFNSRVYVDRYLFKKNFPIEKMYPLNGKNPAAPSIPYINEIFVYNNKNKFETIEAIFMKMSNNEILLLKYFAPESIIIAPYNFEKIKLEPVTYYRGAIFRKNIEYEDEFYISTCNKIFYEKTRLSNDTSCRNIDLSENIDLTNFWYQTSEKFLLFLSDTRNKLIVKTGKGFYSIDHNQKVKKFNNKNFKIKCPIRCFFPNGDVIPDINSVGINYITIKKEELRLFEIFPSTDLSKEGYENYNQIIETSKEIKLQITNFSSGCFCFNLVFVFKNNKIYYHNTDVRLYNDIANSKDFKEKYKQHEEIFLGFFLANLIQKKIHCIKYSYSPIGHARYCGEYRVTNSIQDGIEQFKIIDKNYKPAPPSFRESSRNWVKWQWGRVFSKQTATQQEETDGTEEKSA